ncbi:hypothetical protein M3Y94_00875400 [Aphelenchoides besseyi]|nr:hypothetical protein M3Y94_00875400 [Aphelenchoides besseyi]KAI6226612.1 hypothetical protein M3Y95_00639100 [Aphelenchoides besseyi]
MGSYYTACSIHCHTGTFIIGLLCLLLSLVSLIFGGIGYGVSVNQDLRELLPNFLQKYAKYIFGFTVSGLVETLLLFIVSTVLLISNRTRRPLGYWPFIIFAFFHLFFSLFRILLFVFVLVYTATQEINGMNKTDREHGLLGLSILTALLIVFFCLEAYFVSVVVRGRQFLLDERKTQKVVYRHYNGGGEYDVYSPYRHTDFPFANGRPHNMQQSYVYY